VLCIFRFLNLSQILIFCHKKRWKSNLFCIISCSHSWRSPFWFIYCLFDHLHFKFFRAQKFRSFWRLFFCFNVFCKCVTFFHESFNIFDKLFKRSVLGGFKISEFILYVILKFKQLHEIHLLTLKPILILK